MAGAFLVSDFGLLVMMLRAFSRDLPCCGDRTHCKKQKTRYLCNFLRLGALLGSFSLEICHFLLRFCAAIRDWGVRNNCQSQKSCNSDRFFVSGLLGGPPRQCWDIVGSMRNGGGSGVGRG